METRVSLKASMDIKLPIMTRVGERVPDGQLYGFRNGTDRPKAFGPLS